MWVEQTKCTVVLLFAHSHFIYILVWVALAAPLSEKIKIKRLFEEKWNHIFKFRVTILIYEYLFAMIVS